MGVLSRLALVFRMNAGEVWCISAASAAALCGISVSSNYLQQLSRAINRMVSLLLIEKTSPMRWRTWLDAGF
jgi:hypothetical protein